MALHVLGLQPFFTSCLSWKLALSREAVSGKHVLDTGQFSFFLSFTFLPQAGLAVQVSLYIQLWCFDTQLGCTLAVTGEESPLGVGSMVCKRRPGQSWGVALPRVYMHTLKTEVGSVLHAPPLSLTLGFFPELCLVTDHAISSYKRALLTSKFSYCGLPCSEVTCPSSLPSFPSPAQPV